MRVLFFDYRFFVHRNYEVVVDKVHPTALSKEGAECVRGCIRAYGSSELEMITEIMIADVQRNMTGLNKLLEKHNLLGKTLTSHEGAYI